MENERLQKLEERIGWLEERVDALARENAALRERLRALEAAGELVGDEVDELIAEPIGTQARNVPDELGRTGG